MKVFFEKFFMVILIIGLLVASSYLAYFVLGRDKKEPVDFSNLNYAALGDSITYAMDGTNEGKRMSSPYCELVGDILKFNTTTNYGISGSTVSHDENHFYKPYCERYENMTNDADVVSVMGGANDIMNSCSLGKFGDTTTSTFYGALDVLAKGLKEKYPNAFIFFMTPLKILWTDDIGVESKCEEAEKYRTAIKEVCAKYDIPVLDTANLADFSKEYLADGYNGDGVHPSQAFHKKVLAPTIAKFIKDNYKTKVKQK